MKKKVHHHKPAKAVAKRAKSAKAEPYLVVVRGWMFFVLIALMMGLGLVIGNYINSAVNGPQVAGSQIDLR